MGRGNNDTYNDRSVVSDQSDDDDDDDDETYSQR